MSFYTDREMKRKNWPSVQKTILKRRIQAADANAAGEPLPEVMSSGAYTPPKPITHENRTKHLETLLKNKPKV